jgi:signal transduction histidine kinase
VKSTCRRRSSPTSSTSRGSASQTFIRVLSGPLVEEALALIPKNGTEVINDVPADLPVPNLDKNQFRQVFINLLQNATDACSAVPGGRVVISADGGGDGLPWQIRVTDNGPGMSTEVLDKLFQPLFTTKIKGTGLGLAVVANVIRAHGGAIEATSDVGNGSEFLIVVPGARRAARSCVSQSP